MKDKLNHDRSLDYLDPEDYKYLLSIKGNSSVLIRRLLNDSLFTVGFRKFGESECFTNLLSPAGFISKSIIKEKMHSSPEIFIDYLSKILYRQLQSITRNDVFKKQYAVFQLKENYTSLNDIAYYELCYATNWTTSGHCYYLFRFYLDEIQSSCQLEEKVSSFPYHSDAVEAARPKIIISVHYQNIQDISLLFLRNYKKQISHKLEHDLDIIDDHVVGLVNNLVSLEDMISI